MVSTVNVVEFELAREFYALDITLVREIVEMIPITPVPRAPSHISGIINLRGEITTILNLGTLLGLPEKEITEKQKIIVLVPEAAGGTNVGVIVDDVHSVNQIPENEIEYLGEGISSEFNEFIKGIIKTKGEEDEKKGKRLIIWIDMQGIIRDRVKPQSAS
jgi:purine-binding chemotaxis protein CheW